MAKWLNSALAACAALILLYGDARAEEPVYEVYGAVAGGFGWADGTSDGEVTLGALVFVPVMNQVSLGLSYEGDAEAFGGLSTDVPEDQWTKLGVYYRGASKGFYGALVREGQLYAAPGSGFEFGALLGLGSDPEDVWGQFLQLTYTNDSSGEVTNNSLRLGLYARALSN